MELKIEFNDNTLKSIKKKLKDLHNTHTEWGWINEKSYPSKDKRGRGAIKIAEIARINEYGGWSKGKGQPVKIPARPYFRQAIMMTEENALKFIKTAAIRALSNKDFMSILEQQARLAAFDLITSIRKQNMTENAKKTIDIKGHKIQWTDTGVMLSNITYKVYKTNIDRAKTEIKAKE